MSKRSARPRAVHAKPAWEMLYGINPVEEALIARRRRVRRLYLKGGSPSQRLTRIRDLAAERGVSATFLPAPELEVLCGSAHHQGSAQFANSREGYRLGHHLGPKATGVPQSDGY